MDKPYLRKIEQYEEFTVYDVDGKHIRNNMNREFTNFAEHYSFPAMIPMYEFWIDHENSPDETKYFVEHMMAEWHYCNQGLSFNDALAKADAREKRERNKSALMKKVLEEKEKHPKEVPHIVYKKKLEEIDMGKIEVWLINGEAVRDAYFMDFTEGGHHFVYHFVPENEVWIDDDLVPSERPFVILHELHERYLMSQGMDYNHAHASSSSIEYICRRDPNKLVDYIKREIEKNVKINVQA